MDTSSYPFATSLADPAILLTQPERMRQFGYTAEEIRTKYRQFLS